MKILANKEIKNLFLSLSLVLGVTFLLAEVFLWLSYRRLSLLLLCLLYTSYQSNQRRAEAEQRWHYYSFLC